MSAPSPAPTFDDPTREIRVGALVAALFFIGFLGWAAFAPLDAGAYAQGVVAVSGNRQAVQHRDGGAVSALHVAEGDHVAAGQPLVEINAAELRAEEQALAARLISLQATRARLIAERQGLRAVPRPAEFATLSAPERRIADEALRLEESQLRARLQLLDTQQAVMTQRVAQLDQQIQGYGRQIEAKREQHRLTTEELASMKSLADRGYAPVARVRSLESDLAGLRGDDGSLQADVARARDAIGEARETMAANAKRHTDEVVDQLRQAEQAIEDAEPKLGAVRDRLARAVVRAPATGRVVGLKIFTVGGVVAPGEVLMEVVPDRAELVLDATVSPNDADDLRPGLLAQVRFPSFHERDLPTLTGRVTRVSADSFLDEHTGQRFFKAQVSVPPAELAQIRKVRGAANGLRPGLPATIVIPLRKRTALQYLLEPLEQTFWSSFREH